MADEFGGIPVGGSDEFGGVAVGHTPEPPKQKSLGFLPHAFNSLADNIKGAWQLAQPIHAQSLVSGLEKAKAGDWAGAARDLYSFSESPAAKVARSLVDTAKGSADKLVDAVKKAKAGDYRGAIESYHDAGLHMGTAILPHLEQAAENAKQGKYAEAAGDIGGDVATAALFKGAEMAPEGVRAIPRGLKGAIEYAQAPGNANVMSGTAQVLGGAGGLAHGALSGSPASAAFGGAAVLHGLKNIGEGMAQRKAAATPPPLPQEPPPLPPGPLPEPEVPQIYDDITRGLGGGKYANLDDAGKELVRKLAVQAQSNAARTPRPVVTTTGPIDIGSEVPGERMTPAQRVDAELAKRRAAEAALAAPAVPSEPRVPIWQTALDVLPDARTPETEALAEVARQRVEAEQHSPTLPSGRVPGRYAEPIPIPPATPELAQRYADNPKALAAAQSMAEAMKTAAPEDLADYAKAKGISTEQARKEFEDAGYRVGDFFTTEKIEPLTVQESPKAQMAREDSGRQIVNINPQAFKENFEKTRGEPLAWDEGRAKALRNATVVDEYPSVGPAAKKGGVDVTDGRHRIAEAARRGQQSLPVQVDPEEGPLPESVLASSRSNSARK